MQWLGLFTINRTNGWFAGLWRIENKNQDWLRTISRSVQGYLMAWFGVGIDQDLKPLRSYYSYKLLNLEKLYAIFMGPGKAGLLPRFLG